MPRREASGGKSRVWLSMVKMASVLFGVSSWTSDLAVRVGRGEDARNVKTRPMLPDY